MATFWPGSAPPCPTRPGPGCCWPCGTRPRIRPISPTCSGLPAEPVQPPDLFAGLRAGGGHPGGPAGAVRVGRRPAAARADRSARGGARRRRAVLRQRVRAQPAGADSPVTWWPTCITARPDARPRTSGSQDHRTAHEPRAITVDHGSRRSLAGRRALARGQPRCRPPLPVRRARADRRLHGWPRSSSASSPDPWP